MKKLIAIIMTLAITLSVFSPVSFADSTKIVTLGADLSDEQKQTVLDFFGIDDLGAVQAIEVNNAEEHDTLGEFVPAAQIGTKTYSCAYIEPTSSGGINVKTANLTYVSNQTLANALMTAGIQNCNLIVTAPFPVSGTGALTGVYKAYDSMGKKLDDDKKVVATQELLVTSEMEEIYGDDINQVITEIKDEVIEETKGMSDDEIRGVIKAKADQYNVTLSDDDVEKILDLIKKIQLLDYDTDAFKSKINETLEAISENGGGALETVKNFFSNVVSFVKGIFNKGDDSNTGSDNQDSDGSIFDNIDTDVFNFDK